MRSRTLNQWLHVLTQSEISTVAVDLSRLQVYLDKLELCLTDIPVLTVVGTNGKGSTVAYLENMYKLAGYRVGSYSSPHLHDFNERIRINARAVTDEIIVQAFAALLSVNDTICLSPFDYFTLAALYIFKHANLDLIILEAGIGGRLDAVNAVSATGVVLTSVGLDHAHILGSSRHLIAKEKIAVFRPDCWAISVAAEPPAVIAEYALELNVDFYQLGQGFKLQARRCAECVDYVFFGNERWSEFRLSAQVMAEHVATVCKVSELLSTILPVARDVVIAALSQVRLPGRFEYWRNPCHCVFDVAHNPQAAGKLVKRLGDAFSGYRFVAVVAMRDTKDIVETCRPLLSLINQWYTATLPSRHGATQQQMLTALTSIGADVVHGCGSVEGAMSDAIQYASSLDKTLIVTFGSFSTVAIAQQYCLKIRN
jgi:dihydrofolate synthase / folylpolyglutamate synthase